MWLHGAHDAQVRWSVEALQKAIPHATVRETPGRTFPMPATPWHLGLPSPETGGHNTRSRPPISICARVLPLRLAGSVPTDHAFRGSRSAIGAMVHAERHPGKPGWPLAQ